MVLRAAFCPDADNYMEQSTDFKYLKHLAKSGAAFIHPKGYEATKILIEKLNITGGERILEFGCGTGATLCKIASEYEITVHGVDVLDEMVKSACERIKLNNVGNKASVRILSKGDKLPFDNDSFDKVYAESVLGFQLTRDLRNIFQDIYRVLRNKGIFIIDDAFWRDGIDDTKAAEISRKLIKDFGMSFASPDNISLKKLIMIAEDIGFKVDEVINIDSINETSSDKNGVFEKRPLSIGFAVHELIYKLRMRKNSEHNNYIESYLVMLSK